MNTKHIGIGTTIGGLLAGILMTVLSAEKIDLGDHWAMAISGVTAAIAAGCWAFHLAVTAKKGNG